MLQRAWNRPEELELVVKLVEVLGRGQHGLLGRDALIGQPSLVHRALRPCIAFHHYAAPPLKNHHPKRNTGGVWIPRAIGERREKGEGGGWEVERDGGAAAAPAHAPVGLLRRHHQPHLRRRREGWGAIGGPAASFFGSCLWWRG